MPVPNIYEDTGATHGVGALSVPWGTHNDTFTAVLVVTCAGDGTLGAPTQSGADGTWTLIASCAEGAGAGSIQIAAYWCRATTGSMSNVDVPDTGDHTSAKMFMLQNVVASGNPINMSATQTVASASASISFAAPSTTVANCRIFCLAGCAFDQNANPGGSGWTNAAVDGGTPGFAGQYCTDNGTGGGYMGGNGEKATAGACGTFAHTWASGATRQANIIFAISDTATAGGAEIDAEPGAVTISGTAASTLHGHRLNAEIGAVAVTGTNAALNPGREIDAGVGAVGIVGRDASFFLGTILPKRRGATAPAAGLSTTSPASTEVGDMVMVVTWERGGAGIPTHTLQSGFIEIRTHSHNDGSTDGRLSAAFALATVAGAQSYQAYTSSVGTETWTGCVVIRKNTFAVQDIVSASSTLTTNAVPNPPSVTISASRNYRMFAIAGWHHGSSATITPTAPTNYNNTIEVAGASTGELAITDRELSTGATSEDPGAFGDNIAPNGSVSMTIAIPNVLGTIIASAGEVDVRGTSATLTYTPISDTAYTITAEVGSVAITGTAAGTLKGSEVAAESGSYAVAGVDATLSRGFGVTAEVGAVAIAGTNAGLTAARRLTAEAGAVSITGTAADLRGLLEVGDHGIYQVNYGHAPATGTVELQTQPSGSSFLLLMGGNMNDVGDGPTDSETNTWRQISTSWQYVDAENSPWGVAAWRAINGTGDATAHEFTQGITVFDELTMFAVELKGAHYLAASDRQEEANAGTPGTVGAQCSITVPSSVGSTILVASWWGSGPVGQDHTATPDGSGWTQLEFYGTNHNDGYVQGGVWAKVVSPGTHTVQFTHSPAQGSKAWLMAFAPMPSLSAEVGSVVVAGTNATLAKSRSLAAESGSVQVDGTNADFARGVAIGAEAGALAIGGVDAGLRAARRTSADAGAVALDGVDTDLRRGRTIGADPGAATITGTDASLEGGRRIAADPGAMELSGTAASTLFGREVAADAGSVTITGTDAATRAGRRVAADAGAASLAGTNASLRVARTMSADAGAVNLSGVDASLELGRRIAADAGALGVGGVAAALLLGRLLSANAGAATISGVDAELTHNENPGISITAEGGAVTIAGVDATFDIAVSTLPDRGRLLAGDAIRMIVEPAPHCLTVVDTVRRLQPDRGLTR